MTDVIELLKAARAAVHQAELTPTDLPADPETAYNLALAESSSVAAWKIGGANPWSRKVFGNTEVFFGALYPQEIYFDTCTLESGPLHAPLAEPEIMLEIAEPGAMHPATAFGRMGLGFEIPASVLPDDCKSHLTGQILDRAGAGALWIGAARPIDLAQLETPFVSEFAHNENAPVAAHSTNVFGGPLGASMEFLRLACAHGAALRPGQWIASGGLTPAVPVSPGDRLSFAALGEKVTVEIV